jgi:hypothetical protein
MNVRHVHASGRFTATPAQLAAALDVFAATDAGGVAADVITLTEVSPNRYDLPLAEWAELNGFDLHHPKLRGRDECAVLSRLPIDRRKAWRLTDLTLKVGRTAPLYLVAAQLHDGPWFAVWHSPAHNAGLSTVGKAELPTRVYRSALTGLRAARLKMHRGGVVLAADWNLDLRRPEIVAQLGKPYPRMHFGVDVDEAPTEGGRVIDGVLTNLPIVESSVTLPAQPGFDHKGVLTVLGEKT